LDNIKTYDYVNYQNPNISFEINRMETIFSNRNGAIDTPHRHDFFTVILAKKAQGKHIIDFNEFILDNLQVYFIYPGQVHQMIEEKASIGYAITFSHTFLAHNNIPLTFIDNLNLFKEFGNHSPLKISHNQFSKIEAYAEAILEIHNQNQSFKYEAIGALLKLILIECNHSCNQENTQNIGSEHGNHLLINFKNLLNKHYKQWHGVREYAEQLHVSPDYLNRIVKSLTGKTTKEHIQCRIMVAAKRLIYFSDKTNKELAFELGFSEPANFSNFFKKHTGLSPSQFKKAN